MVMSCSRFYMLNQWEVRPNIWGRDGDEMFHVPCNSPVVKAVIGNKWACRACYEEPPEEVLDVIRLGRLYKGWDDPITINDAACIFYASNFYFYESATDTISATSNKWSTFYINIMVDDIMAFGENYGV